MSLVVSDEKNVVRSMCAEPDTTLLPDTTLGRFFTVNALAWINQRRPAEAIGSFETVAEQQDYSEKPATALKVRCVWWMDASWLKFSPTMEIVPGSMDVGHQFAGVNTVDNPDLVVAFYKKLNAYQDYFRGVGEETPEGKIRLKPAPTTSGDTVYFSYTYKRWADIEDVANEYVDAVRNYVAACVMRHLMLKRGEVRGGRNWSGGGGERESQAQEQFMAEAERQVPQRFALSVG